jgi:hypothetical protein
MHVPKKAIRASFNGRIVGMVPRFCSIWTNRRAMKIKPQLEKDQLSSNAPSAEQK